ncbi:MAG: hypothetical protein GY792_03940 [Gammaproteobacteria bacterium]|nr:hypothetical protein [Gammaproteobacteria bacterium]
MSEIAHYMMQEEYDRPPQDVELVIPAGTADRVAAGEETPAIPSEMVFIVGDVLVVRNEDSVDHQLGPVWVPPGTSASLPMEDANNYDYTCSFRPSQYLGLDVRQGTTVNLRLVALSYVTPATAVFLFVYSLVLFPLDRASRKAF